MMSSGHGQVVKATSACAERRFAPLAFCPQCLVLFGLLLLIAASGCARFPAIDPNGQSIFLPFPASTQLTVPQIHAGNGNPGIIPQEAYPTPLPPPACIDGSCNQPGGVQNLFQHHKQKKQAIANHFAKKDPGACGQIQLSPMRIVAPVNGEVLLMAGICGKDGYLLKREPLEWMLAPGSVGQFIEVGDDNKGKLCSSLRSGPKVEKLGVDYARGRTSSKAMLLTKGTPGCEDDLELAEGQTWLSISSPNEGVSRVTVLAPDSELWDKRRQTATIYWVDSQANFPEPIRIDTSTAQTLTTRVTSAENMRPAEGWLVRYTIVDPNLAVFLNSSEQPITDTNIFVTKVGPDGMANARVRARGPIGVTPVHVEVIRPLQAAEGLPELILHQADTFITVSAPGLHLTVNGPETAGVGQIVEYFVSLANPGDMVAENAVLRFVAPVGTTVVEVTPTPNASTNNGLEWNIGPLNAGQQLEMFVRLQVLEAGNLNIRFTGQAVGLEQVAEIQLRSAAASVDVSMLRVPENTTGRAEVGETVYYEIAVKNTGPQVLVNSVVQVDMSPGWQEASQGRTSVPITVPMLQPGQVERIPLALRVIQEGQHTAGVTVKSQGGAVLRPTSQVGLIGVPPRQRLPRVEATIRTAPENQTILDQPTFGFFIVNNTGDTPLTRLDVTIEYDPALRAVQVDTENSSMVRQVPGKDALQWTPRELLPGQFVQLKVQFLPLAQANAGLTMTVVDGETRASQAARLQIIGRSGPVSPPNANNNPGTPQVRSGNWRVFFETLQNPSIVGNEVSFEVNVTNAQNMQDSNVRIQLGIPEGIDLVGIYDFEGQPIAASQTQRGVYSLQPAQYLRPNEPLRYTVRVIPRIVQEARLSISVASDGIPTPQVITRSLTVNPR